MTWESGRFTAQRWMGRCAQGDLRPGQGPVGDPDAGGQQRGDPGAGRHVPHISFRVEESCLEGQEALCLLEETWAEEHGLSQGGELTLSCYTLAYKPDGVFPQYVPVGDRSWKWQARSRGATPGGTSRSLSGGFGRRSARRGRPLCAIPSRPRTRDLVSVS